MEKIPQVTLFLRILKNSIQPFLISAKIIACRFLINSSSYVLACEMQ